MGGARAARRRHRTAPGRRPGAVPRRHRRHRRAGPAGPARARAHPGHTDGHTVFHLPQAGILVSGDALVSGHATSRIRGPQLLPDMFHHERARALASLEVIGSLAADTLLPGHGPVHRGSVREAAQRAREHAV
ncbi:MBL fold metallo-hydrolase [Streptomyces sp. Tue 6430]|nr:MBL fold metallo-hydrolase [Streptomyces sp. Tue 6430]